MRHLYLPARPEEIDQHNLVPATYLRRGSLIPVRKWKLYYLRWLGLALYPVLVLAAPLSGRGAVPPVPAALPLFVFLTSDRRMGQSQPCMCKITDINCAKIIRNPPRKHEKRHWSLWNISLGGWDGMNLPFRRGWPGFPSRAPGPILTPPLVAPDYNTLSILSTILETTQAKKEWCIKNYFIYFFPCGVRLMHGAKFGQLADS